MWSVGRHVDSSKLSPLEVLLLRDRGAHRVTLLHYLTPIDVAALSQTSQQCHRFFSGLARDDVARLVNRWWMGKCIQLITSLCLETPKWKRPREEPNCPEDNERGSFHGSWKWMYAQLLRGYLMAVAGSRCIRSFVRRTQTGEQELWDRSTGKTVASHRCRAASPVDTSRSLASSSRPFWFGGIYPAAAGAAPYYLSPQRLCVRLLEPCTIQYDPSGTEEPSRCQWTNFMNGASPWRLRHAASTGLQDACITQAWLSCFSFSLSSARSGKTSAPQRPAETNWMSYASASTCLRWKECGQVRKHPLLRCLSV